MTELVIFLLLLGAGYFVGSMNERQHFASIRRRETEFADILTFSTKHVPSFDEEIEPKLVIGSVVVSIDYFKRVAAGLRMVFGGRVSAYESLLERARREAILRMKENANRHGAKHIFNVKLETASITKGAGNQIGCVEVYAYGTCIAT